VGNVVTAECPLLGCTAEDICSISSDFDPGRVFSHGLDPSRKSTQEPGFGDGQLTPKLSIAPMNKCSQKERLGLKFPRGPSNETFFLARSLERRDSFCLVLGYRYGHRLRNFAEVCDP
jgi:hypothetical protein